MRCYCRRSWAILMRVHNGDLGKVRELIEDNRVPAPARVGAIAPIDVVVPPVQRIVIRVKPLLPDPTDSNQNCEGREITSPVNLLKAGDKVGNSEAVLLQLHICTPTMAW